MTEPWNTDENYRAYVMFAATEGFIPLKRSNWAAFNRSFNNIDKCVDELARREGWTPKGDIISD